MLRSLLTTIGKVILSFGPGNFILYYNPQEGIEPVLLSI